MTPSQKLRSIADSTGLDGIADAIREIANEIEHNNAPALPVAWWIPKAEQFCLAKPSGERPFAKAWEPLYAAAPAVPQGEAVAWRVSSKDEPELGFWLDEEGPSDDDMGLHYEPLYTAPAAPSQPAVPQGDPTEEMLVAGLKECEPLGELIDWREGFGRSEMRAVWEAMLGATPAPAPAQEPVDMVPRAALHEVERERDWYKTRAQTMHEHQNGQVWYWQGDGEDHPETLVNSLPVVIRADQLRELIAKPAQEVGLTDEAVNDAAKVLAERFDYPWEHMPEEGRKNMRVQARAVVEAALRAKGGK